MNIGDLFPKTPEAVNKHIQKRFPKLILEEHDGRKSCYWTSNDEELSWYLVSLYSTTASGIPASQRLRAWMQEASDLLSNYKPVKCPPIDPKTTNTLFMLGRDLELIEVFDVYTDKQKPVMKIRATNLIEAVNDFKTIYQTFKNIDLLKQEIDDIKGFANLIFCNKRTHYIVRRQK